MGDFYKNFGGNTTSKKNASGKLHSLKNSTIAHRAVVLSAEDVEANRSQAYTYLSF